MPHYADLLSIMPMAPVQHRRRASECVRPNLPSSRPANFLTPTIPDHLPRPPAKTMAIRILQADATLLASPSPKHPPVTGGDVEMKSAAPLPFRTPDPMASAGQRLTPPVMATPPEDLCAELRTILTSAPMDTALAEARSSHRTPSLPEATAIAFDGLHSPIRRFDNPLPLDLVFSIDPSMTPPFPFTEPIAITVEEQEEGGGLAHLPIHGGDTLVSPGKLKRSISVCANSTITAV